MEINTMRKTLNYNDFECINRNLYKLDRHYFRLFGTGITPNGCWIENAKMRHLVDIDVSTGNDVYGTAEIDFGYAGTVQAGPEYIRY